MSENKKKEWTSDQSVDDLLAMVKADPGYVARRNAEIAKLEQRTHAETEELRKDLRQVGVPVPDSAWDLVNGDGKHAAAIPVLIRHLRRGDYHTRTRQGTARALAIPEAHAHWQEIREMYERCTEEQEKHSLAVALSGMVNRECCRDLVHLLRDKKNGESRVLLLSGLEALDKEERATVLGDLKDDPDLTREIKHLLRTKRS